MNNQIKVIPNKQLFGDDKIKTNKQAKFSISEPERPDHLTKLVIRAVVPHMGPEGPSNFIKKLKGSVLAIFFFVVT